MPKQGCEADADRDRGCGGLNSKPAIDAAREERGDPGTAMPMVRALTAAHGGRADLSEPRECGLGCERVHGGEKRREADDELALEHAAGPSAAAVDPQIGGARRSASDAQ